MTRKNKQQARGSDRSKPANRSNTGRSRRAGSVASQSGATEQTKIKTDPQLIMFNKPFGVLSQFTDKLDQTTPKGPTTDSAEPNDATTRQTLADYIALPGVYPAGRLDRDSEGLLLLTNDGALQARISDPKYKLQKTYLVQLDGQISKEAIDQLLTGILLKDGPARAMTAREMPEPDWLWARRPPVRYRKNIPTSWLELSINEGRNRQVRRMTAKTGFPTLRLIRTRIGPFSLSELSPGHWLSVKNSSI